MTFAKKLLYISVFLFSITSCNGNKIETRQSIDDNVFWTLGDINQTVEDAEQLIYEPLELAVNNISDKVGIEETYVWVKIRFTLNDNLKNKLLGLVVPYIHFAEKTWLNGVYIGQYGEFWPNRCSPMYQAHFYSLPQELLNQDGENYLYFKILSYGSGTISNNISIDEFEKSQRKASLLTFACSKIYMLFSGILFCAFLLFIILYYARKEKNILNFAMICLTSFIFLSYYDAPEMPYYGIVGWGGTLLFTKIIQCCFFYFLMYAIVTFILTFVGVVQSRQFVIFKRSVVAVTVIITLAMPDYIALSKLCIPMIITYLLHFLLGMSNMIKSLFDIEKRRKAVIAARGFAPMVVTLFLDIIIRHIIKNVNFPYFVLLGLIITIIYFIVYFSIDYGLVYRQNQRLTDNLRREVELQTVDLTFAKEALEQQVNNAERDMNMAAIVQQKFFANPAHQFVGWEYTLLYDPLDKVSGDLYDFYTADGTVLHGLSLFDASGHGVAAALITMLSKNIIFKSFQKCCRESLPLSQALKEINHDIITAKGDVENYLTGIILRFGEMNGDMSQCEVELSSAGHPYPIVYSAELKECISLKDMENGPHYGAIGMAGIDVAYCDIQFTMKKGDLLLCFSDGITETSDENRKEYGRARLEQLVKDNADLNSEDLCTVIKKDVAGFRGENPRDDDITLIILKKE